VALTAYETWAFLLFFFRFWNLSSPPFNPPVFLFFVALFVMFARFSVAHVLEI